MSMSKKTLLERLNNAAGSFKEMLESDARKVQAKDVDRVEREVPGKLGEVEKQSVERAEGMMGEMVGRVRTLYTMIFDRSYKVQSKTKLMTVAALLYFVVPTDLVPDFIPGIGFIDDALVLRTLWSMISKEVDAYTRAVRQRLSSPSSPTLHSAP